METTPNTFPAVRRTRRSPAQWDEILAEHFASKETPQQLADRLGCALSTIEIQMKRATTPEGMAKKSKPHSGFVEVAPKTRSKETPGAMTLTTESGVTVTFSELPSPEYLAAALGMRG